MRIGVIALDIEGVRTVLALRGQLPKQRDAPMQYVDLSYHDEVFGKR